MKNHLFAPHLFVKALHRRTSDNCHHVAEALRLWFPSATTWPLDPNAKAWAGSDEAGPATAGLGTATSIPRSRQTRHSLDPAVEFF